MVERYRIGLTQLKAIPSPLRGRVRVGVKSHASNIVPNCVTPNQKTPGPFRSGGRAGAGSAGPGGLRVSGAADE